MSSYSGSFSSFLIVGLVVLYIVLSSKSQLYNFPLSFDSYTSIVEYHEEDLNDSLSITKSEPLTTIQENGELTHHPPHVVTDTIKIPATSYKIYLNSERTCNQTFHELMHGDDGLLTPEKLTGLHIFLRHGHRTAMDAKRAVKTPIQLCDIRTQVATMLERSEKCLSLTTKGRINPFLYSSKCVSSQLTSLGIHQHEVLGNFLKSRYTDFTFQLSSTSYSRTYLSLLSFLSNFKPDWCSGKRTIVSSRDSYFRSSISKCNAETLLSKQFLGKPWPDSLKELRLKMTRLFKESWIDVMQDTIYIDSCSSAKIPFSCATQSKPSKCLSQGEIDQFVNMTSTNNYNYFNDDNFRRHSYLSVVSLIKELLSKNDEFHVYSGHDLTLSALLSFFGFSPSYRIPLASRVIFEFFESNRFRVLFNGKQIYPKQSQTTQAVSDFHLASSFHGLFPNSTDMKSACSKSSVDSFSRRKRQVYF